MKTVLLISLFALCLILNGIDADVPEPPDGGCWVKNYFMGPRKFLRCVKLGIDGRSFEQVIGDGTIPYHTYDPGHFVNGTYVSSSEYYFKNVSISEIADLVQIIELADSRNVTMGENALSSFMNLTELKIRGPYSGTGERGRLNLAPGALRQSPQLEQMHISRMDISDESIPELLEMKDRLMTIMITDVTPEDKVLTSVGQFTKLQYMGFFNCSTRPFPTSVIKSFAAALVAFEIQNCNFPKLAKDLFASSPKLSRIFLKQANLAEVEPGALDQNPELWAVILSDNDLPSLPSGLFSKLSRMRLVTLEGNPRLNGTIDRSNFTHVQDYDYFRLYL